MGASNAKEAWSDISEISLKKKGRDVLRESISKRMEAIKPEQQIRTLVFGPTGVGKSSFLNGMKSAIEQDEYLSKYFSTAPANSTSAESHTQGFNKVKYFDGRLWMIDMYGIHEKMDMTREELEDIVSGKAVFKGSDTPDVSSTIHCVILLVKLGDQLSDKIRSWMTDVKRLCGRGLIQTHIVVTHIDRIGGGDHHTSKLNTPGNIPSILSSRRLYDQLDKIKTYFNVENTDISVVRNFPHIARTHVNSEVLYLSVLDKLLRTGKDGLERVANNPKWPL